MDKVRLYKMLFRISIAVFIIGILFRVQHWPYGLVISVAALFAIAITSYLYYSSKLEKSFTDQLGIVLIPLWSVFFLVRITHSPYQSEFRLVLGGLGILYTVYQGLKWYEKDKLEGAKGINFERTSYILGTVLIVSGLFLKYQHWPYSSVCLYAGLGLMVVSFFLTMISKGSKD